ncbi:hypothetical protein MNB_SV-14-95 [hydrothermal vent metagenome]|uniref:Uncharacterized protein n=1 Tax=hydrothermal vent metagenome TaxID=652676 RepID=A0A1W1BZ75_9ZZZZ
MVAPESLESLFNFINGVLPINSSILFAITVFPYFSLNSLNSYISSS